MSSEIRSIQQHRRAFPPAAVSPSLLVGVVETRTTMAVVPPQEETAAIAIRPQAPRTLGRKLRTAHGRVRRRYFARSTPRVVRCFRAIRRRSFRLVSSRRRLRMHLGRISCDTAPAVAAAAAVAAVVLVVPGWMYRHPIRALDPTS